LLLQRDTSEEWGTGGERESKNRGVEDVQTRVEREKTKHHHFGTDVDVVTFEVVGITIDSQLLIFALR